MSIHYAEWSTTLQKTTLRILSFYEWWNRTDGKVGVLFTLHFALCGLIIFVERKLGCRVKSAERKVEISQVVCETVSHIFCKVQGTMFSSLFVE